MTPRTGRRPGEPGTRDAILRAARSCFGEHGFTGATIRRIAAEAGVDPALVLHYFGNKVDLFVAAVDVPASPSEIVTVAAELGPDAIAEALLRRVLSLWDDADALAAWLGLLRSASTDERAARMLEEFITEAVIHPLGTILDAPDAQLRLALVASQIVGLGLARHVLHLGPLSAASGDELVAAIAPTLQRYVSGDLASARRPSPDR